MFPYALYCIDNVTYSLFFKVILNNRVFRLELKKRKGSPFICQSKNAIKKKLAHRVVKVSISIKRKRNMQNAN